jgi:uncharacterized protein
LGRRLRPPAINRGTRITATLSLDYWKVTTFSANALHLELPNLHAIYDGTLSADGGEIRGTFVQGAALPLVFKRVEKLETLNRPQNPKPPYPYDAQDVVYEASAGIKLAGTLTLPRGPGPFPAALLITGSGPQDRDESLLGHKPFLVIADYLTRRGIAILRVGDRGVGGSTGSSTRETLDDMGADVVTGVGYLKGRKGIEPKHIGVIGHSEGGIVGPAAAARSADVAFVIMLAGTGVVGTEVLKLQGEADYSRVRRLRAEGRRRTCHAGNDFPHLAVRNRRPTRQSRK